MVRTGIAASIESTGARSPALASLYQVSRFTWKKSGRLFAAAAALILVSWSLNVEGSITSFQLMPSLSRTIWYALQFAGGGPASLTLAPYQNSRSTGFWATA